MAKSEKMIVKKLEGVHVRKDGVAYQLIFGERGLFVIEEAGDGGGDPPWVSYLDWWDAAKKLVDRASGEPEQQVHLRPDPHAQPAGVPQDISSPK